MSRGDVQVLPPPPGDADAPPDGERAAARPSIYMDAELHRIVTEAVEALTADPAVYQRDARLTRIVRVAEAEAEIERMTPGTPQLRPMEPSTLKERLSAVAKFFVYDARKKKWLRKLPTGDVVGAVAARGEWAGIPPITGAIETPSMRPDGSVIAAPGYDAATGYVYMPQREYPPVPARPTIDDARSALRQLQEPFEDFPITSEAGRTVPIAATCTLVGRPAIRGATPAFFVDAAARGSGKTLTTRCITVIAHGREAAVVTWPEGNAEELEKILGAYALRGASVVLFDNVTGSFSGGPLDKVLTATNRVDLRVLGKSEMPSMQWRGVILATGNNADIAADTARRTLISRLEPQLERPEERELTEFRIPQLERWCAEHHPRLAVAALTLLRAYVVAGRPTQGLPAWGSFQPWSDLIASAIVWAGGPNVLEARATAAADEDETTAALRSLLRHWPRLAPNGISARDAIETLYTPQYMRGEAAPDGFDDLRGAIEALAPPAKLGNRPEPRKLGYVLRRARGRVLGGRQLDKGGEGERGGVISWLVREVGR